MSDPIGNQQVNDYIWRILVVDANPETFYQIQQDLNRVRPGRYILEWARQWDEGLRAARTEAYDIILIAGRIGDRPGTELAAAIAAAGCRLPAVILGGGEEREHNLQAVQTGVFHYTVTGEVTPEDLERSIRFAVMHSQAECGLREQLDKALQRVSELEAALADLKRITQALEEMEERFHLASQAVTGVVYDWDLRTGTVFHSAAIEDLLGVNVADIPGDESWWRERIHPEDYARIMPEFNRVASGEADIYSYEYRIRHKDGHWVFVHDRGYVVRDSQGKPVRVVGSTEDITRRKTIEARLRESEARFRQLANAMPQLVWSARADGVVDYINQRFHEIPDITLNEQGQWQLLEAVHPEDRERVLDLWNAVVQTGETYSSEFRFRAADGDYHWHLARAVPVRDEEGRVERWFGYFTDIHHLKMVEEKLLRTSEALAASEQRYRAALEDTPIFVYTTDLDLRYTWISASWGSYDVQSVLGRRDDEIFPAGVAAELMAFKRHVLETGLGERREIALDLEGATHYFDVNAKPYRDLEGHVIGLIVAFTDVTELRQLERQRMEFAAKTEVQRRMLENRESERIQIARDLHDGPVQELLVASFNLQHAIEAEEDPQKQETLRKIQTTLMDQVEEIRRVLHDLRPPALMSFGLDRAIRTHCSQLAERHPEIKFQLHLARERRSLPVDLRLALYRIYQELMNNIMKHARASEVHVTLELDGEKAALTVQDDGVGFDTSRDWVQLAREGHLGLLGLRERVEIIDGELFLHSQPGKGTLARVVVPRPQHPDGGEG